MDALDYLALIVFFGWVAVVAESWWGSSQRRRLERILQGR